MSMRLAVPFILSTLVLAGLYWRETHRVESRELELLGVRQELRLARDELAQSKKAARQLEGLHAELKKQLAAPSVPSAPAGKKPSQSETRSRSREEELGAQFRGQIDRSLAPLYRHMSLTDEEKERFLRNAQTRQMIRMKYGMRIWQEKDPQRRRELIEEQEAELAEADRDNESLLGPERYATLQDFRSKQISYQILDQANAVLSAQQKTTLDEGQLDRLAELMRDSGKNSPIGEQLERIVKGDIPELPAEEAKTLFNQIEEIHGQILVSPDLDESQAEALKSTLSSSLQMLKMMMQR
ncbi:MAG: hypothetical protein RL095_2590 [Verrucomicrobiota bacterium]|jgi:hypothetical protein